MEILFSGCSIVQGAGLPGLVVDPNNFTNIIGNILGGRVKNIAIRGNSNERIFLETAHELSQRSYDIVIVCWTGYPRHVFWPGLELYECRRSFTPTTQIQQPTIIPEHNGNDIVYTSDQFEKIKQWFMMLTHDHYYILDICRYISVLKKLVELHGGKIYFVNTLTTWDNGYFEQFKNLANSVIRPDMLTDYTNQLLNSNNRDDEQINALFHLMCKDYQQAGGIKSNSWLNLYQSLHSLKIDVGTDNEHPGPLSHKKYAELLINNIQQNTVQNLKLK